MTIRNPVRRKVARDLFLALTVVSAFMLAFSTWTVVSAPGSPAGAATSSGQVTLEPTTGNSSTIFGFTFDSTPQCDGDTAVGGYNWSTFMIPATADPGTMTFSPTGPNAVTGEYRASFLSTPNGENVAMQSTGIAPEGQPGLITGIPQFTFEFYFPGEVPAGDYLVGLACTEDGGQVVDTYYSRIMTVTASDTETGGPAAIQWAQGAGGGTTTTTAGGTTTTTDGSGTTTTTDGSGTTTTTEGSGTTTTYDVLSDTYGGTPSAASPVSTAGQLPYTGNSPIPMVVWAVALVVFGRMAMLMGKRPKVVGDDPTG